MTSDVQHSSTRRFDGRIVHAPWRSQVQAHDRGEVVGYLQYGIRGTWAVLGRTEVRDPGRAEVIVHALVMAALELMRARGHHILAVCPHVRAHLAEERDATAFPAEADDLAPLDLTA